MDIVINPEISLLEQVKIQAMVLVPLLKTLRAELGEERANELVTTALRDWSREMFLRIGALMPGSPKEKWEALNAAALPRIGSDIDLEMLKQEPEAMELHIAPCGRTLQPYPLDQGPARGALEAY